jgi:hypothetical protein
MLLPNSGGAQPKNKKQGMALNKAYIALKAKRNIQ